MATHSSTLAWRVPWMEEPGGLQSMRSWRVGHDWATSLSLFTIMHWRRKWQPTPVFLPGESQGRRNLVGWSHRVGHDWSDLAAAAEFHLYTYYIFFIHSFIHFREGTATHSFSCLENPMDRGAWCATVHGSQRVGHDWVTKHSTAQHYLFSGFCIVLEVITLISMVAQLVKNQPAIWETWVWFLGWEDPLEKG